MTQPATPPAVRPLAVEALIAALLLASIHGFTAMPFMRPVGADLHNLYVFHQCAARDAPYLGSGPACGDVAGRDMIYPPVLYFSFAWVRPLNFEAVTLLWSAVVAIGTFASLLAFAPAARWRGDGRLGLFAGLLLVGYPLLFALERGNNDVIVLLCWAGALLAWRAGRAGLAGLALGVSVAFKIYPAVGALPVAVAVVAGLLTRPETRRAGLRFAAGGVAGAALPNLLLWDQVVTWATVKLPGFSSSLGPTSSFNHSLPSTFAPMSPVPFQAVLLLAWSVAAVRRWRDDPALVMAGALAASTSVASSSFDYNLITALPLLLLQFQGATAGGRWRWLVDLALLAGLVAVAGHRAVYDLDQGLVVGRVYLLWGWMVVSAVLAAWRRTAPTLPDDIPGEPGTARLDATP